MGQFRFRLLAIATAAAALALPSAIKAQDLEIGKTVIKLQSPVVIKHKGDSLAKPTTIVKYGKDSTIVITEVFSDGQTRTTTKKLEKGKETVINTKSYTYSYAYPNYTEKYTYAKRKFIPHSEISLYGGFGFVTPTGMTDNLPVAYGDSYNLEFGFKFWYRPAKHYAIGTMAQYTFQNYRTIGMAESGAISGKPNTNPIIKEDFRTDALGTGIMNRIYFSAGYPKVYIDFGVYGDWLVSRRFNTKYYDHGRKNKIKYKDGSKFLPLQGGVYGAIGVGAFQVYCRYRFTELFSNALPFEPDRLTIGLTIEIMDL